MSLNKTNYFLFKAPTTLTLTDLDLSAAGGGGRSAGGVLPGSTSPKRGATYGAKPATSTKAAQ